jgi:Protein of unknown function with HXXEE motif
MLTFSTLELLLPAAIMLHVTEEFLYPGGFPEWYTEFIPPKTDRGIKTGYLVWINTLMIGVCVLPVYYGETFHGFSTWYCVAAIAAANACFHIWGVIKLKKYSPGVITGTLPAAHTTFCHGYGSDLERSQSVNNANNHVYCNCYRLPYFFGSAPGKIGKKSSDPYSLQL